MFALTKPIDNSKEYPIDILQTAYLVCRGCPSGIVATRMSQGTNEKYRKFPRPHLIEQYRAGFPRMPSLRSSRAR